MAYTDGPLGYFAPMEEETFQLRGMAERQMRLDALRASITPEMASHATTIARDFPWMPPGVVSSMMLAHADDSTVAHAAVLSAQQAMERGDFRPPGAQVPPTPEDEQRKAVSEAHRSGLASIFAPIGEALGDFGNELKGAARYGLAALESPLQELSGVVQEGLIAARDPNVSYGDIAGSLAGSSTLGRVYDAAVEGRDYDLGQGIMPAGGIAEERALISEGFARTYVPEIANNPLYNARPGELYVSPGRLLALTLTKPGTREFQLASGVVDFAFSAAADPTNIVFGGAAKALKARKLFGAQQGLRAAFPRAAEALTSIGIVPGARPVVVADEVMGWMNRSNQGRNAVRWLEETSDFDTIWRGLGKKVDAQTVLRLAEAGSRKAVTEGRATRTVHDVLLEAFTGKADDLDEPMLPLLREKFSAPTGMRARVKSRMGQVRFVQMVPHTAIDVEDLDQGVETLDRVMRNAKLPQEIISQRINEFVRAESPDHMRETVDNALGDIYAKVAGWDPEVARKVTRRMRDRNGFNEAFRLYDIDANTGLSRAGVGTKVDRHGTVVPTATILSEYMHRTIGLPDPREIRRATSAFKWLTADRDVLPAKVARWGIDAASGFMTGFWQPLQLFRAAWLARVSMEQMPRMAAGGLESLGNHPARYLMWALGGATERGALRGAKKLAGGGRGTQDLLGNPFRRGEEGLESFTDAMNKGKSGWAGDPTRAGVSDDYMPVTRDHPKFVEAWVKHNINQLVVEPVAQRAAGGLDADDLASIGKFDPVTGRKLTQADADAAAMRNGDTVGTDPTARPTPEPAVSNDAEIQRLIERQELPGDPGDSIVLYRGVGELGQRVVPDPTEGFRFVNADTGDEILEAMAEENIDELGAWWSATPDAGELYAGGSTDDVGAVFAVRFPRSALRAGPEDASGILARGEGVIEGVRVWRGGKWVDLPVSKGRKVLASADDAAPATSPGAPAGGVFDAEDMAAPTAGAPNVTPGGVSPVGSPDAASFTALSEWFWSGAGVQYRRRLMTGGEAKSVLSTREGADQYLRTRYVDRIRDFTGGDTELMEAIATGNLRGVNLRGMDWNPPKAVTPAERAALKRLKRQQKRVYAAMHEKLPELEAAGVAPKYVKIPRDEGNPSVRRVLNAFVDTIFDVGFARPDNFISRSPAYRQFFFKRADELIPFMDRPTRRMVIQKAKEAGVSRREVTRMVNAAKRSEPGVINDLESVNAMAHDFAAKQTKRLLYDVTERHQFAEILRVTNPFLEAWYEMFSTWTRLAATNPKIIRRGQQIVEGARSSGFFYEDEVSGKEMFAYPGGEMMTNLGLKIADFAQRAIPGGSEGFGRQPGEGMFEGLGLPEGTSIPLTGTVQGLNLAGNILPGFGPVVTVPTQFLLDPQDPDLQGVRGFLLPFGADDSVLDAVAPAYIKRFATWFQNDPEADEMLRNTQLQVMTMLSATGQYTSSELGLATEEEQARLVADSENIAKRLFFIRGFAQFGLPTGPTPRFTVEDLRDPANKQAWAIQALSHRYRELVEQNGEDSEAAMRQFVDEFGWDFTIATQGRSRAVAVRPVTAGGYDWMKRNPELETALPFTVGLAAPDPNGEFDIEAYAEQFGDTREPLTPDQMARLRNNTLGWMAYTHAQTRAAAMGDAGEQWLRVYREQLRETYPGFDSTVLGLAEKADIPQMVDEVKRWPEFPAIAATPAGEAAARYLQYRQQALDRIMAQGGAGESTLRQANDGFAYRQWLRAVGEKIAEQNKDFAGVWRYVFEPELNQMNDDDVMLELQGGA
jgi:hypothetical protein